MIDRDNHINERKKIMWMLDCFGKFYLFTVNDGFYFIVFKFLLNFVCTFWPNGSIKKRTEFHWIPLCTMQTIYEPCYNGIEINFKSQFTSCIRGKILFWKIKILIEIDRLFYCFDLFSIWWTNNIYILVMLMNTKYNHKRIVHLPHHSQIENKDIWLLSDLSKERERNDEEFVSDHFFFGLALSFSLYYSFVFFFLK